MKFLSYPLIIEIPRGSRFYVVLIIIHFIQLTIYTQITPTSIILSVILILIHSHSPHNIQINIKSFMRALIAITFGQTKYLRNINIFKRSEKESERLETILYSFSFCGSYIFFVEIKKTCN